MEKYKIIKETKLVSEWKWIETEVKVPTWWFKFLRFLFADDELVKTSIQEEQNRAFWCAAEVARYKKEDLMQKKLLELGYKLQNNFPMARIINDKDMPDLMKLSPDEIWSIVPNV